MPSPFVKEAFTFRNPDGSLIDVLGWGDQHYAVFESLDGFTVIKDPNTGYYHYARLSDDRSELLPTDMRVGAGDPRSLGLEPHLRANPQAIREKVRRDRADIGKPRWEVRRERRRAALQRALEARRTQPGPQAAPPSEHRTGTYVGLCVLIQFPDVTGTITREGVSDFCNKPGYNGYGNNGSVYDYYFDNSGGRLKYTNVVTSYYTAKHKRSYYTDESIPQPTRAWELIKEALDNLKSQHFDFSQLSSDSDSYIYALNVFYAGDRVNNWGQGLWPHSWHLESTYDAGSGKMFYDYQITNMGSQLTLRTFCHENGHMLCDFPDLYDYGYQSNGDGDFCLMARGGSNTNPVEIDAYLKAAVGWAQVTSLTPGLVASVPASQNVFFIHNNPAKAIGPNRSTEYFIIQNRQQQGRDASLPAAGLAIWHVDELGSNNDEQMSPSQHYECALEQADGHFDLEEGTNYGDSADLFASPAATRFAEDTSPDSNWWDGSPSGLNLSQISPPADVMTFVQVGPPQART